jgi:tRNA A37 threonylcarbamoyltransferase TsaD
MKILAIETSCDETGISLLWRAEASAEAAQPIVLLGNALASQIALHAQYGGVFPAMAKRAHAEKIVPLIKECLGQAGMLEEPPSGGAVGTAAHDTIIAICTHEAELVEQLETFFNTYEKPDIDYIAVTVGPGLEPALWVGINTAKVLSTVWNIPVIPVNHMEGHVVTAAVIEHSTNPSFPETPQQSHFSESGPSDRTGLSGQKNGTAAPSPAAERQPNPQEHLHGSDGRPVVARKNQEDVPADSLAKSYTFRDLQFPLLALLVSGGHTELVLTKKYGEYEKIGQTRDDAVGEAFDKVARMLGLPYPGGPAVSKLAREFRTSGEIQEFVLPRPMLHSGDYDFSFSGIKTAMLYTIRDLTENNTRELTNNEKMALACAFENAVVEVLIKKTLRAAEEFHIQTIVVGGGVAGNTYLREQLTHYLEAQLLRAQVLFPEPWLATDNAVMIGLAAFARVQTGNMSTQDAISLKANGNLSIETK